MKRSLLAAGVGICIFAATMFTANKSVKAEEYTGTYQDTTPKKKKDTSTKKPDTVQLNQSLQVTQQ